MKGKKRILSLLLCGAMLFSGLPLTAFAEGLENGGAAGLCEHHTAHNESCGYTEGTPETPCSHEHMDECYTKVTSCVHEHTADCYPAEDVSGNTTTTFSENMTEPTECSHECSEESGCITKALDCRHEHDSECGYTEAVPGTPCTYVCGKCNAQDSGTNPAEKPETDCICKTVCTEEERNADCPVCGAEGADLTLCKGAEQETDTPSHAAQLSAGDVQKLIDELPTADELAAMTPEEQQAVYDKVQAAYEAYDALTDEQKAEVAGAEVFDGLFAVFASMTNTLTEAPEEQFSSLTPGATYWFDLSDVGIPGTVNTGNKWGAASLPDTKLHWVPFTYVGTINAYVLNKNSEGQTDASQKASEAKDPDGCEYGYTYDHSLFISDYAVTHSVGWGSLNDSGMIFGKDYRAGGVKYTLRAPTAGSNQNGYGWDDRRGIPENNEWDVILNKGGDYIKNWSQMYTIGQDTCSEGTDKHPGRGSAGIRYWYGLWYEDEGTGFRPVLELPNASDLPAGFDMVSIELNGGKIGNTEESVKLAVKAGEDFKAPESEGITAPDGMGFTEWLGSDSKTYNPDDIVPDEVTTLTAQWLPAESTPEIAIDYANEILTNFEDSASYIINGDSVSIEEDGTLAIDSSWFGSTLSIVKEGNGSATSDSKPQSLEIPARLAAPNVSINYEAEALSTTATMQYRNVTSEQSDPKWQTCEENMKAAAFGWDGSTEITVTFRTAATSSAFASAETPVVTIPPRLNAPGGLQGENETFAGNKDGKITGTSSDMEYRLSSDTGWTPCTGESVTDLTPGEYLVRYKATDSAFASSEATVEIKTGQQRTYTLNVTAPDFEHVTYGYIQPEAKAITINSTGNSDSTISSVTVNSGAFVIDGSGPSVTAGGSISTWTIQPAAGLNAGTYTATITVSYTGDAEATAQVSFTVNQVEQAAPDKGPELESRDRNSITLKAVPDNGNGAKAEYSRDGGASWQTSPVFTGLSSGTRYSFLVRYGATEDGNFQASPASPAAEYSTQSSDGGGSISHNNYRTITARARTGGSISPSGSISVRKGGDKTFTVTPDSGYCIFNVLIDGKSVGAVTSYTFENVQEKHTIEAVFAKDDPYIGVDNPFTDVNEGNWFYNDVMFVYQNDLMSGTSSTTFEPNANTSCAQLAVIFYRLDESPVVEGRNSFTDVEYGSGTAWYYDAVTWAQQNGIVAGYEDGTFRPNDPITREQLAMIFYNYAKFKGYDTTANGDLSGFVDAGEISVWAQEAVKWAVDISLFSGDNIGGFLPKNYATRAEFAAVLHRFWENNNA